MRPGETPWGSQGNGEGLFLSRTSEAREPSCFLRAAFAPLLREGRRSRLGSSVRSLTAVRPSLRGHWQEGQQAPDGAGGHHCTPWSRAEGPCPLCFWNREVSGAFTFQWGGGPTICVQAPDPTPLQLVDAHPSLSVASAPLRDCRTTQTKPHSERPGSSGARALAIQGPNCGQASDSPEPTAWQARPGPPGGTLGGAPAKALSWGVDGLLARPVSSSH